jgi:hypothetical protein
MTTDNSEHKPAWRAAWRLDDPDWIKARQRAWKKIKNLPFINLKKSVNPAPMVNLA